MGGEPGGPGGEAPGLGHGVQGVHPLVYKCTAYKGRV